MQIAAGLLEQIVEHAQRDAPNECCGFVAMQDGQAVEVVAVENTTASPFRFEMGAKDTLWLLDAIDSGREVAVYHSHTRSDAYPSQTDVNFAANWPGVQWLIIGVAGDEPAVRNYRIEGGTVTETEVQVDDAG
jgi:proteasome lid subunit RPN8/RPN11